MEYFRFHVSGFEPLFDQFPSREIANGFLQGAVPDVIKRDPNLMPPSTTQA
jgi:hypothetical protein